MAEQNATPAIDWEWLRNILAEHAAANATAATASNELTTMPTPEQPPTPPATPQPVNAIDYREGNEAYPFEYDYDEPGTNGNSEPSAVTTSNNTCVIANGTETTTQPIANENVTIANSYYGYTIADDYRNAASPAPMAPQPTIEPWQLHQTPLAIAAANPIMQYAAIHAAMHRIVLLCPFHWRKGRNGNVRKFLVLRHMRPAFITQDELLENRAIVSPTFFMAYINIRASEAVRSNATAERVLEFYDRCNESTF